MEQIAEEEERRRGQMLADALKLKKDPDYKDRYETAWGTKTALGLFRTIKDIIERGK